MLQRSIARADPIPYRALALGAAIGAAIIPVGSFDDGPVTCPFRLITGLPCPACGLTRSCIAAFHLDFDLSFARHPCGPVVALVVIVIGLSLDKRLPWMARTLRRPVVAVALGGIWLTAWVVRLAAS